jgi:MYXO-CTERM domain-containing protein
VGRLAASISRPLLVGVSIDVEGVQAMRLYPRSIPDLFAEDELLVTGRLRGAGTAKFTIRGKLAGKPVVFTRSVELAKAPRRPWVASMWAQARVDHLLEEIALGAKAPELVEEVTTLALAYNFVTPYTAFLAIPESELGELASTVAQARERKKKIMAANTDVANLQEQYDNGAGAGEALQITATAPTIDPTSTNQGVTIDKNYMRSMPIAGRTYEASLADGSRAPGGGPTSTGSRRHGCAGCASAEGHASSMFVWLGLVLLLQRRRRRRA